MTFSLPINLDDMGTDPKDYDAFCAWLHTKNPKLKRSTERLLTDYAYNKKQSLLMRLSGNIGMAVWHERQLSVLYSKLPDSVRW